MSQIHFKNTYWNMLGNKVLVRLARNISPKETDQLIKSDGAKIFYQFSHPCLLEIEVYLLANGYVVKRYDHFTDGVVFQSARDFYITTLNLTVNSKYISTTYPRHRIYYGKSCRKIHYMELDDEYLKILLRTGEVIEMSEYELSSPIIKTAYDDFIYRENKLFYTLDDLKAYLDVEAIRRRTTYESRCVAGRNIYGEQFVDHIPEMMDQLAELLRAPRAWFDFSIEHRDKVQLYFFRQIFTDAFNDKAFLPMLAYLGQMHRHFYKSGEWILDYDPIYDCWNPDIRREDGMMARMDRTLYRIMDSKSPKYRQLWNVVVSKKS